MSRLENLERVRANWMRKNHTYKMVFYTDFKYKLLENIIYKLKRGRGKQGSYNDCIIMADTETSKHPEQMKYDEFGNTEPLPNHVVAWTISIRAFHMNIVTLYGTRPSEFIACLNMIRSKLQGDDIYIYFHNLPYDWYFLRRFMLKNYGEPKKQLNVKSHYPIYIKWDNGIILRDSLILSGCKLEKWAKDLNVEHQKAVGSWDYDRIRNQGESFTEDEKTYIENDTLAGVECIDAYLISLHKTIYSIPYTATGIPREEVQKRAAQNRGHENFLRQALTWEQFLKFRKLYHGGYSHANRFFIDELLDETETLGFDFTSSYPFCLLAFKYPCEKFRPFKEGRKIDPELILNNSEKYAFIFKVSFINIKLKDDLEPMPALQSSKCDQTINLLTDNGRVISAGYLNLYMCEQDLHVIADQYCWQKISITECEVAKKDYLPRWFTDYVFECYQAKCLEKIADPFDPVRYALSKARVNSIYGLTVQASVRRDLIEVIEPGYYPINEDGDTAYFTAGEYREDFEQDLQKAYEKYLKSPKTVLNYQIGTYCTAYAFRNLFRLGKCVKRYYRSDGTLAAPPRWYYSDTDSAYSDDWDYTELMKYNQDCKARLRANNYGPVIIGSEEFWLGVADHKEPDDTYTEFKVLGSKRYAGRSKEDNKIHITVAGVPKKAGALCLENDLKKFTKDFIFDGNITGKLTHYYIPHEIYIDEWGNEVGDSIDLQKCDYHLDAVNKWNWLEEVEIAYTHVYGEESDRFDTEF